MDELRFVEHWKCINLDTNKEEILFISNRKKYLKKRKRNKIVDNDINNDSIFDDDDGDLKKTFKEIDFLDKIKETIKEYKDIFND